MKYVKILGVLAIAAASFMAFAGSASAATLTSPKGVHYTGTIHAESSGATTLDGTINITCQKSTVHGHVTNPGGTHGGTTTTVEGNITSLTFTECGNHTVTVVTPGTLTVHSIGGGTGTVTSHGAKVTVLTHSLFLGTRHCIYVTDGTHVGTFTESNHPNGTGSHTTATIHIGSAPIEQEATDGLCGNDALWTGTYTVTTPDHLYLD